MPQRMLSKTQPDRNKEFTYRYILCSNLSAHVAIAGEREEGMQRELDLAVTDFAQEIF